MEKIKDNIESENKWRKSLEFYKVIYIWRLLTFRLQYRQNNWLNLKKNFLKIFLSIFELWQNFCNLNMTNVCVYLYADNYCFFIWPRKNFCFLNKYKCLYFRRAHIIFLPAFLNKPLNHSSLFRYLVLYILYNINEKKK